MLQLPNLAALTHPAAANVQFGWFDLAWPNIAFWVAVVLAFLICAWLRIPLFMEADAAARRRLHDHPGGHFGAKEQHS